MTTIYTVGARALIRIIQIQLPPHMIATALRNHMTALTTHMALLTLNARVPFGWHPNGGCALSFRFEVSLTAQWLACVAF